MHEYVTCFSPVWKYIQFLMKSEWREGCSAKAYIFYISPFPSTRTKMNKPGRPVYVLHSKLAPGAVFD